MKILYIQETDWLKKGPQQQHHLLERLSNKGHQIVVLDYEVLWDNENNNKLVSRKLVVKASPKACKKCNILLIRPSFIRIPIMNYFSILITYGIEIYRLINKFKPNVIIGEGVLTIFLGSFLAKIYEIPFVYNVIDKNYKLIPQSYLRPLGFAIEKLIYKNSSKIVCINEELKNYCIRMGADPSRCYIIRAGVETSLFKYREKKDKEMRKKFNLSNNDFILFFMGWFYTFSGLKEVLLRIKDLDYPNIKLFLLGEGPLKEELIELREKYNLQDSILIHDWIPYRDLPKYISMADVCLLPTYNNDIMNEIVPIKLYEYLAVSKPVIATYLRGIFREFGKYNGIVYIKKSKNAVDKALKLRKKNLIKKLGNKGRNFIVKNCNWDSLIKKYFKIISQ